MNYSPAMQTEIIRIRPRKETGYTRATTRYIRRYPYITDIKQAVYRLLEVGEVDADSKLRRIEFVEARQVAHTICYKYRDIFGWTLALIGKEIGNLDHSLVTHSVKTVKCHCETEQQFKWRFDRIETTICQKFGICKK